MEARGRAGEARRWGPMKKRWEIDGVRLVAWQQLSVAVLCAAGVESTLMRMSARHVWGAHARVRRPIGPRLRFQVTASSAPRACAAPCVGGCARGARLRLGGQDAKQGPDRPPSPYCTRRCEVVEILHHNCIARRWTRLCWTRLCGRKVLVPVVLYSSVSYGACTTVAAPFPEGLSFVVSKAGVVGGA